MSTSLKRRSSTHDDAEPPTPSVDLYVVVIDDDAVLYWPGCGHAEDDDLVLYDRPVCVICED